MTSFHIRGILTSRVTSHCLPACCSYKKLAEDVKPGMQVLCADGSIVLEVLETDAKAGIVTCRCQNNAKLGCAACSSPH